LVCCHEVAAIVLGIATALLPKIKINGEKRFVKTLLGMLSGFNDTLSIN